MFKGWSQQARALAADEHCFTLDFSSPTIPGERRFLPAGWLPLKSPPPNPQTQGIMKDGAFG